MDIVDFTNLWVSGDSPVVPPPPPDEDVSHAPHDYRTVWRAADPRLRRLLLRGILPEEFIAADASELQELFEILDDLDRLD